MMFYDGNTTVGKQAFMIVLVVFYFVIFSFDLLSPIILLIILCY